MGEDAVSRRDRPPRHDQVAPTLAPDGLYALPVENLSDEIPSVEPDPRRPKRRGPFRRMLDQLLGRHEPPAEV